jgi:cobalamin 5'-phosphate synthase/cobalamin synthase
MKSLLASIAFCTRIPISTAFDAEDVGRAARWFPLIGAMLGAISLALSRVLLPVLPATIVAVLILVVEVLVTGALHYDGLADTLDGLGGGKSPEDRMRIMRDHVIGSYGATALILLVALKAASITALISVSKYSPYLLLAPVIARWNIVLLSLCFPYARPCEAVSRHIGKTELAWASVLTACITLGAASWRGAVCWGAAAIAAVLFGNFCLRKIGGVTGDTLGATEQISESIVLLLGVALR